MSQGLSKIVFEVLGTSSDTNLELASHVVLFLPSPLDSLLTPLPSGLLVLFFLSLLPDP